MKPCKHRWKEHLCERCGATRTAWARRDRGSESCKRWRLPDGKACACGCPPCMRASAPVVAPESTPRERLGTLARILGARRFTFATEKQLQDALEAVLRAEHVEFYREVPVGPRDRIDFLTAEGIGLEVKVDGSLSEVTRQLHRYAQSVDVMGLLLVTSRSRHDHMPPSFNGKPVLVHYLAGSIF